MLRDRILPRSEVISRAILLEDSPCCGAPCVSMTSCVHSYERRWVLFLKAANTTNKPHVCYQKAMGKLFNRLFQ